MTGTYVAADLWINEYLSPFDIYQHGIRRILAQRETPFQTMFVVETGPYGKGLVLDGKWQTSTVDEFLYHEPLVHAPLTLHGNPKRVLIAGGADGGALREVLKWKSVEEAVVADIDGDVIAACRELLPEIHQGAFDDPRARIVVGDAWELVASPPASWDVIIADLTDPIEDGPAYKLFTREFFELCRRALRPGGVFLNQAGSASPAFVKTLARVVRTLQDVFQKIGVVTAYVPTYGSQWGLAIAGDFDWSERLVESSVIDRLLEQKTTGTRKLFDGAALQAMLVMPRYMASEIAASDTIYTLENPPGGCSGMSIS